MVRFHPTAKAVGFPAHRIVKVTGVLENIEVLLKELKIMDDFFCSQEYILTYAKPNLFCSYGAGPQQSRG